MNLKPVILVVAQSEDTIRDIRQVFQRDFDVHAADGYESARELLLRCPMSVVIVDSALDADFRILDKAKSMDESIVLIYLADNPESDIEIELLSRGATDIIIKPVKPQVLEARVKNCYQIATYEKGLESVANERVEAFKASLDELHRAQQIVIDLLTTLINYRDVYTSTISGKTTKYVEMIIEKLREDPQPGYTLDPEDEVNIISFSQIRDIGKLSVPDTILSKKGFLTEYEFDIIQKHALLGAQILENSVERIDDEKFLKTARDIILYHHEKWDGNGYPRGLKGEQIPLCARIVSIVDVFGALINSKEYRDSYSYTYAFSILLEGRGRNFDPHLLDIFLQERTRIMDEL